MAAESHVRPSALFVTVTRSEVMTSIGRYRYQRPGQHSGQKALTTELLSRDAAQNFMADCIRLIVETLPISRTTTSGLIYKRLLGSVERAAEVASMVSL